MSESATIMKMDSVTIGRTYATWTRDHVLSTDSDQVYHQSSELLSGHVSTFVNGECTSSETMINEPQNTTSKTIRVQNLTDQIDTLRFFEDITLKTDAGSIILQFQHDYDVQFTCGTSKQDYLAGRRCILQLHPSSLAKYTASSQSLTEQTWANVIKQGLPDDIEKAADIHVQGNIAFVDHVDTLGPFIIFGHQGADHNSLDVRVSDMKATLTCTITIKDDLNARAMCYIAPPLNQQQQRNPDIQQSASCATDALEEMLDRTLSPEMPPAPPSTPADAIPAATTAVTAAVQATVSQQVTTDKFSSVSARPTRRSSMPTMHVTDPLTVKLPTKSSPAPADRDASTTGAERVIEDIAMHTPAGLSVIEPAHRHPVDMHNASTGTAAQDDAVMRSRSADFHDCKRSMHA
jgi:hypothetical protein